jgi:hypothetical protein
MRSRLNGKLEVMSAPFRCVWPSELDRMTRLAGMTLRERYSGWNREPFTSESTTHVSVWQKKRRRDRHCTHGSHGDRGLGTRRPRRLAAGGELTGANLRSGLVGMGGWR